MWFVHLVGFDGIFLFFLTLNFKCRKSLQGKCIKADFSFEEMRMAILVSSCILLLVKEESLCERDGVFHFGFTKINISQIGETRGA